ncbi:MAG: hypothetical protein JO133_10035 [Burkholderiaceae bacterium]|nr:hypothetical protein [Burkholderiaceae bacterium]
MKETVLVCLALVGLAGCATPEEKLDKGQATAVQTAISRGRFEMGCPEAKGQVLSRTLVEPPWIRGTGFGPMGANGASGIELVEYTVGVEGCGKRMTQVVACAVDGTGCYSGVGGPR